MSSAAKRKRGNEYYMQAVEPGLAPVIVKARLNSALELYNEALSNSTSDDKAACLKNIGMVHYQYLKREVEENSVRSAPNFTKTHYLMDVALTSFSQATKLASTSKPINWHTHIAIKCLEIAHLVSQHFKHVLKEFRLRIPQLEKIIYNPQFRNIIPCVRAFMCKLVVDMYFKEAVTAKSSRDFRFGLQNLAEANRPLVEGLQACNKMYFTQHWMTDDQQEEDWGYEMSDLKTGFKVLEEEITTEQCILGSMQNIFLGDQFHDLAISSTDGLITSYTFDAIDCFRAVLVSSREQDIESEAIACSRLGVMYTDVMKMPSKGKDLFKQSIELATCIDPHVDHNEPWYKAAWEGFKKFQDALNARIEDDWTAEKEPYTDEMEVVLTAIADAATDGITAFLKFIYTTHLPKNENHSAPTQYDALNHKSLLKKGMIHYHFDNNRTTYKDVKWTMTCEEIAKHLSALYQTVK